MEEGYPVAKDVLKALAALGLFPFRKILADSFPSDRKRIEFEHTKITQVQHYLRYTAREEGAHGFYFNVMRTKLARAAALGVMRDYHEQPESELSTGRCVERLVIAGTPQSVADQILEFRREVGAFGTLLYTGHDWADPALARRSMELMAKEVWPRIDRALQATTPNEQTGGKVCSD